MLNGIVYVDGEPQDWTIPEPEIGRDLTDEEIQARLDTIYEDDRR